MDYSSQEKKMYIKHDKVEDDVCALIEKSTDQRKFIFIHGVRGVGKTELLNHIEERLGSFTVYRIDIERFTVDDPEFLENVFIEFVKKYNLDDGVREVNPQKTGLRNFIRNAMKDSKIRIREKGSSIDFGIGKDLIERLGSLRDTYIESTASLMRNSERYCTELAALSQEAIAAVSSGAPTLVLVDGIDEADSETLHYVKRLFEHTTGTLVVASSLPLKAIGSQKVRDFINLLCAPTTRSTDIYSCTHEGIQPLRPFTEKEVQDYFKSAGISIDNVEMNEIYNSTQGIPKLLDLVANVEFHKFAKHSKDWLQAYCDWIAPSNIEKDALCLLLANGGRLSEELYVSIANSKGSDELDAAMNYLIEREVIEKSHGCFSIAVPLVEQFLRETYLKDNTRLIKWKDRLYEKAKKTSIVNPAEKYRTLINLAIERQESDTNVVQYAHEACNALTRSFKPEAAKKLIASSLAYIDDHERDRSREEVCAIAQLRGSLVRTNYLSGSIEDTIESFILFLKQSDVLSKEAVDDIRTFAGSAYYYLNKATETLATIEPAISSDNDSIACEALLLKLATLDLQGSYAELDRCYCDAQKVFSDELRPYLMMVNQMTASNHETCVKDLIASRDWFAGKANISHKTDDYRRLACSENNVGVEYLMSGEFSKARSHLEESRSVFEDKCKLESYFAMNNLGLYYQYAPGADKARALRLFNEAYYQAQSPLQRTYVLMNRAIVHYQLNDISAADSNFQQAASFAQQCPDPIVQSYFVYNKAIFDTHVDNIVDKQQFKQYAFAGMNKYQNARLVSKREALAASLSIPLSECEGYANRALEDKTNRRTFFARQEWEPCELMFYC